MKGSVSLRRFLSQMFRSAAAVLCVALIALGEPGLPPGRAQQPAAPPEEAPKIPNDQLDSLVAPIALYPDPLLAQVLAASTYPLEIIQLQQFLDKNKDLKDQALTDAVMKQNWDPTVQAMAALPEVVKRLADDIQWTTDLGNAFLAQQSDVMDAVQRMRKKAQDKGLKSDDKMQVETKVVENKSVIVIEQANPQVVYVPSYIPTVVYGAPVYPYPPIYYPPPSYYAGGLLLSFGIGVAIGAAWGGGWCCSAGWGSNNNITINNNNNFVRNSNNRQNINSGNRVGGGNNWQHNPQHRGGAPYSNRATANKYGGTARGESRQGQGQLGGRQQPGAGNRPSGGAGAGNRPGGGQQPGVSNRPSPALQTRPGGGGADRIGGQDVSRRGGGDGNALGGGSRGGFNGPNAGSSSGRGASSLGSGGGGGRRGGGGGVPRR